MSIIAGFVPAPRGVAAVRHGLRKAEGEGVDLVVVIVASDDGQGVEPQQGEQAPGAKFWEELDGAIQAAKVPVTLREQAARGSVGEEMVQLVEQLDATLLVMGVRRRAPEGELRVGPTLEEAILRAPCPVLLVKN